MYIIREIFHLHFGHYRAVKELIDDGMRRKLLLQPLGMKVLTDFTGEGYRLIIELPYASLSEYETALKQELGGEGWTEWYAEFQHHVKSSEREILKQVK